MGLLRSVAAVVLILAALSACGGGEGAASDGVDIQWRGETFV